MGAGGAVALPYFRLPLPDIVAVIERPSARALVRQAFSTRTARLSIVEDADALTHALHSSLVDAVVVDVGTASADFSRVIELARDFPSIPFAAIAPFAALSGELLARLSALDVAEVLVEGVDDTAARALLEPRLYSRRFAAALSTPPPALALGSTLQRLAWSYLVAHGGRSVRASDVAEAAGVSREHLSRTFHTDGAPNLKRVIDLVRLIAAAELCKNPGFDVADVARVLDFASSSHLAATATRVAGVRPGSLARLRAADLIDRFIRVGAM